MIPIFEKSAFQGSWNADVHCTFINKMTVIVSEMKARKLFYPRRDGLLLCFFSFSRSEAERTRVQMDSPMWKEIGIRIATEHHADRAHTDRGWDEENAGGRQKTNKKEAPDSWGEYAEPWHSRPPERNILRWPFKKPKRRTISVYEPIKDTNSALI